MNSRMFLPLSTLSISNPTEDRNTHVSFSTPYQPHTLILLASLLAESGHAVSAINEDTMYNIHLIILSSDFI